MHAGGDSYDCIIIGAGIGGLVCGCYLAKAGMRVLIAEQHHKPGGYCSSFRRNGFTFDAAAHSFGGGRPGGIMHRVFADLEIAGRLQLTRHDPSDIVLVNGQRHSFWADTARTSGELADAFPAQARGITGLFRFLTEHRATDFAALRKKSFQDLLDLHVSDRTLRAVLALPVLGNGDLPPSQISAFSAAKILTEFLLDGGYYPSGGMQAIPDALADRFREYGGELLLACPVRSITVGGGAASGVVLQDGRRMVAGTVVSNCDALQTFTALLPAGCVPQSFSDRLAAMIPSLSIFVLYLGIDGPFDGLPQPGSNLWFSPHDDVEDLHREAKEMAGGDLASYFMVRVSPDGRAVLAFVNAAFKDAQFWTAHKQRLADQLRERIERTVIPGLSRHVVFQTAATPQTMQRYTGNHAGAAYGWSQTVAQFADPDLRRPPFLKGLVLAGHWTTFAQGLPGVAYLGYDTARGLIGRTRRSSR